MVGEQGPGIVVWPKRNVLRWMHPDDENSQQATFFKPEPLIAALGKHWGTDAHCVGYRGYEGIDEIGVEQPPLRNASLKSIADMGGFALMHYIFFDLDLDPHGKWKGGLTEARDVAEDVMAEFGGQGGDPLYSAGIYTTNGGLRLIFIPDKPIPVETYKAVIGNPKYKDKRGRTHPARGFAGHLWKVMHTSLEAHGLVIDPSANQWSRCFRMPFVLRDGAATQSWSDYSGLEPVNLDRWLTAEAATSPALGVVDVYSDRPQGTDLEPWIWTTDDYTNSGLQRHLAREAGLYKSLKGGSSWYAVGERNESCYKTVALLAEVLHETEPNKLYGCTYRSVAAGAQREGTTDLNTALDELWGMCCARAGVEIARAQERADASEIARARREAIQEKDLGPAAKDGMLPAIVVHGSSYYVLDASDNDPDGNPVPKYFPPTTNQNTIPKLLETGCACLDLNIQTPTGAYRPLNELIANHSHIVDRVTSLLYGDHPYIDGDTLFVPTAHIRDVTPRHHPEVHRWLTLLGGDDSEALLDWLATATDLRRPTSALYLQGEGGTGKTMLGIGLASLWGEAPVPFKEALARFNASMARSPVVLLDEGIHPRRGEEAAISAIFRSLVADTERRIEAKGRPTTSLTGAVRVVITANNGDALPMFGNLTGDDIAAIATRVRHFNVNPLASSCLGWGTTTGWVKSADNKPGKIAEHVLWLRDNREVVSPDRFLVPGVMTEYHEKLALTDIRLDTLAAVAAAIDRGPEPGKPKAGVLLEPNPHDPGGKLLVLVNVKGLKANWTPLTGEYRTPAQRDITGALNALGGVEKGFRRNDARFYLVPHRYIFLAADKTQISSTRKLRQMLQYPKSEIVDDDPVIPVNFAQRLAQREAVEA
jgi:hypothetical protein